MIEWGKKRFDNVCVEPGESPPIVSDSQQPAFFSAMVNTNYEATPRPADLAAWRTYVLYNSLPPETPLEAPEPATRRNASSEQDVIAEVWCRQSQLGVTIPRRRLRGFIPASHTSVHRLDILVNREPA